MLPAVRHSKGATSAFERRHTRHDDVRINAEA
jgi:hypothetical protein